MGGAIGSDGLLFLFYFSCSFYAPSPLLSSSSSCFSVPFILLLLMTESLQSFSFSYSSESFPLRHKIPVNLMFCSYVEVLVFVLLLILLLNFNKINTFPCTPGLGLQSHVSEK